MAGHLSKPELRVKPDSQLSVKMALAAGVFFLLRKLALKQLSKRHVLVVLSSIASLWLLKNRAKAKYNSTPGDPESYPVVGSLPAMGALQADSLGMLQKYSERTGYKAFEGVGPCDVCFQVLQEPDDFRHMLKDNWTNYIKYHPERGVNLIFEEMIGRGIFGVDGDEWSTHRKAAAHLFSGRMMKGDMQSVFNHHARQLCDILADKARSRKPFDLQVLYSSLTFDTMCEIAFGISPNTLAAGAKGNKSPFLEAFDAGQNLSYQRVFQLPFAWQAMRALGWGAEGELKKHIKVLYDYVEDVVVRRRAEILEQKRRGGTMATSTSTDLLTLFIEHAIHTKQTGEMLKTSYLRDMVLNFMIAGRDTTSVTLTNITKLLALNPEKKARFLDEVGAVNKGELRTEDALKMQYADACFNETLRMYPPVSADSRFAVEDDIMPSGFKIRKGAMVVIPTKTAGTNPAIYPDPLEFRPERWLPNPKLSKNKIPEGVYPSGTRRTNEYMQPVFWGGPRICLGRDMARLEVKIVAAHVLSRFDVTVHNHREHFVNAPVCFYVDGLPVNVDKRA